MKNNTPYLFARLSSVLLAALMAWMATSCVHEFPEPPGTARLRLLVHHETDWTWYDYYHTSRAGSQGASTEVRYVFKFFEPGTDICRATQTVYSADLSLADFTVTLEAPAGESDLRVWSDYVEAGSHAPMHHDADDFSAVTLSTPHNGNTDTRDCFEGMEHLSISAVADDSHFATGRVDLRRNTARVIFIATDAAELAASELSRRGEAAQTGGALSPRAVDEALRGYTVVVSYPMYMPCTYNMFLQKPVDSRTGVSFEAPVTMRDNGEAHIGMDYVFVNHADAGAQMSLSLRNPAGDQVQLTDVITVPLLRGRTTVVRGRFLTMQSSGGVGIDPSFNGDFNIEFH